MIFKNLGRKKNIIYIYMCQALPPPPSPPPPWDGSNILAPYEIFPLPPRVVWWGCGIVPLPPPCGGGGMIWYVGYVWCVWSVWYGMSGWYCMDGRYVM